MSMQTPDLFLLDDLEADGKAGHLDQQDREALHSVAAWITSFILEPNAELGRPGPVCPVMPTSVERRTMWLAPSTSATGTR